MAEQKIVTPTGEKGEPVVTTESPLADPENANEKGVRYDRAGDRPLYEWEVDPKKQVGPAAQQQPEPTKAKSARRK